MLSKKDRPKTSVVMYLYLRTLHLPIGKPEPNVASASCTGAHPPVAIVDSRAVVRRVCDLAVAARKRYSAFEPVGIYIVPLNVGQDVSIFILSLLSVC